MNKKKLSVVMAGAMLASSVAPVLAAEAEAAKKYEVSANELGILKKELRTFLNSKKFHMTDKNLANESVYYLTKELKNVNSNDKIKDVDASNIIEELKAGEKLYVWSEGFKTDEKGNYFSTEKTGDATKEGKYTLDKMISSKEWFDTSSSTNHALADQVIKNIDVDRTNKKMIIHLENGNDVTYTEDDYIVNLHRPTADGYELNADSNGNFSQSNIALVDGFVAAPAKPGAVTDKDLANELLAEIVITPGGYNLALEDLYDGLFLTDAGHDFFTKVAEAASIGRTVNIKGNANVNAPWIKFGNNSYENGISNAIDMKAGKGYFTVEFGALPSEKLSAETYTITGKDEKNLERIAAWLIKPQARVDILAGDNRYETAVEIAKEYADLKGPKHDDTTNVVEDVVLVNGGALVDGLAAAPLAASLEKTNRKVPMLLTEADHLPKATAKYLKELMANHVIGADKSATIHLVGGEAVLSKSLERELRGLGFRIERHGGDNREETSLAVAEAMKDINGTNSSKAFVVGAKGEADAMSIAAVASETKTPIVVGANNGISEDAVYELRGKDVTIIGGESVVTKDDYKAIKEEAKGIQRISGDNRKATNAEIIRLFYKDSYVGPAKNVVVAKDGQRNKMELVDALVAANMAASKDAPIVLATDKLTKAQENALELNATSAHGVYQVGIGVARDVVKTIAENLGLSNR